MLGQVKLDKCPRHFEGIGLHIGYDKFIRFNHIFFLGNPLNFDTDYKWFVTNLADAYLESTQQQMMSFFIAFKESKKMYNE